MSTQLQALELWRFSLVASVRADAPDLSACQMAMLLCVYLGQEPHTVRGLAKELDISKPAVSRALDRLGELGYIRRERDDLDRRNVLVQRTVEGGQFLMNFAKMIQDGQSHVNTTPEQDIFNFAIDSLSTTVAALGASGEDSMAQTWSDVAA